MLRKKINFKLGGSSGNAPFLEARRLARASYLVPGVAVGLLVFLSITALLFGLLRTPGCGVRCFCTM